VLSRLFGVAGIHHNVPMPTGVLIALGVGLSVVEVV
jgi:hypothetical protein